MINNFIFRCADLKLRIIILPTDRPEIILSTVRTTIKLPSLYKHMKNTIIKIFEDPSGTECFYGNEKNKQGKSFRKLKSGQGEKKHSKEKKRMKIEQMKKN